jgi:ABC-type sulfate/molybdate transport systems ATPase subunit
VNFSSSCSWRSQRRSSLRTCASSALLLDEPFGALDAQVRKELRRWLRQLHEELKFTSVLFRLVNLLDVALAHDHHAVRDFHRLFLIVGHEDEQVDEPEQLWREPATRFVLEFMGEVNRLQGTIRSRLVRRLTSTSHGRRNRSTGP